MTLQSNLSGSDDDEHEAEESLTQILSHDLEAWTLSFHPQSGIFSGGDDATLRYSSTVAPSDEAPQITWSDRKIHGAGVTAILPLGAEPGVVVTGSYDDRIRVVRVPDVGRKEVLAEEDLGGGVWRLKLLEGNREERSYVILASCMHAGTRIVRIQKNDFESWSFEVVAKFEEHKSMNYGSDVQPGDGKAKAIISTSFYDKLMCLWRYELP